MGKGSNLWSCFRVQKNKKEKSKLSNSGSVKGVKQPIITTASNDVFLSQSSIPSRLPEDKKPNPGDLCQDSASLPNERVEVYPRQGSESSSIYNGAISDGERSHAAKKTYSDASTLTSKENPEEWLTPLLVVLLAYVYTIFNGLVFERFSMNRRKQTDSLNPQLRSSLRSGDTGYGSGQISENDSLPPVTEDHCVNVSRLSNYSLDSPVMPNSCHEVGLKVLHDKTSTKLPEDTDLGNELVHSLPAEEPSLISLNTEIVCGCSDSQLPELEFLSLASPSAQQHTAYVESSFGIKDFKLSEKNVPEFTSCESSGRKDNIIEKIDLLETHSSKPLHEPSNLSDVLNELEKLCNESKIPNAIITHDPGDYKKMVLNGDGVTKLLPDLEKLQKKYGGYIIQTNEFTDIDYFEPLGNPPDQTGHISLRDGSKFIGTVGLFVNGKHLKSGVTKQYAVTAAHCVLDSDTQKSAGNSVGAKEAQRIFKKQIKDGKWTIKPFNQMPVHPLNGFPQYRMRCFTGTGNWHDKFSFDIALLEVGESATILSEAPNPEGILEISFKEHLDKMIERRVRVYIGEKNLEGWIIPAPKPIRVVDERTLIPGLMVHIATESPLFHGQSGSAIRVMYRDTSQYDVIGILHGKSKLSSSNGMEVYLGVLLYPNLHQIEADYPIKHFDIARCALPLPNVSIHQKIPLLTSFASSGYYTDGGHA